MSLPDRPVPVTGAANGIGPAIVGRLVAEGAKVRAVGSDETALAALAALADRADVAERVALLLDGGRSGFVAAAGLAADGGMRRKMIHAG